MAGNPRRNALFGVVPETYGLRRLDGGVRSQIRTGLSPDNCPFAGYFRELLPFIGKRAAIRCANSMASKGNSLRDGTGRFLPFSGVISQN